MSQLDRLLQVADTIATKMPGFQSTEARQFVTERFMELLREAARGDSALQCSSEEPVLSGAPPKAGLRFDFHLPIERTAVEFALGKSVREFEKDLLKAILARDDGKRIECLALAVPRGKMPKVTSPARQAMVAYVETTWRFAWSFVNSALQDVPGDARGGSIRFHDVRHFAGRRKA